MNIDWPEPGRYIVAVSGGADSMVLLDVLAAAPARGYELMVAHFDHGLRSGSGQDRQFVEAAAVRYGLGFKSAAGGLGRASEAEARAARHGWLEEVRGESDATGIITAHHQDDLIETSLLNLARGSGRLGLAPMPQARRGGIAGGVILRPFLGVSRAELRAYAAGHNIVWREDPTNADVGNPRNLLRHRLLPAADPAWRAAYLENIAKLAELNTKIAQSISIILESFVVNPETYAFPLEFVRTISRAELEELLLAASRNLVPGIQLDRRLILEIADFARTGRPHKYRPLRQGLQLVITARYANLTTKTPH